MILLLIHSRTPGGPRGLSDVGAFPGYMSRLLGPVLGRETQKRPEAFQPSPQAISRWSGPTSAWLRSAPSGRPSPGTDCTSTTPRFGWTGILCQENPDEDLQDSALKPDPNELAREPVGVALIHRIRSWNGW